MNIVETQLRYQIVYDNRHLCSGVVQWSANAYQVSRCTADFIKIDAEFQVAIRGMYVLQLQCLPRIRY